MADPKIPANKPRGVPAQKPDAGYDNSVDENGDAWRHAPIAPKDKGAIESLGESISETVTGPSKDRDGKPKL